MKTIVYDNPTEMIAWAQTQIPDCVFRDDAHAIGLTENGAYRGVVVFDSFTTTSCWVSVASDGSKRFITREFIVRVFAYPFLQLGYPRINSLASVLNAPAVRFNEQFGWQREGVMRNAGAKGEDMIMFGMLREECRWLMPANAGKPALTAI